MRVLLSPGRRETIAPRVAEMMGGSEARATRNAVEDEYYEFAQDCRSNAKNVAVVYIAGHGVQLNNRGALVLLEDFAVPNRSELHGAIDIVGCHQAMQSGDGAPVRQLWLSDACRPQRPAVARNFEMLTGAFNPSTRFADGGARSCPLFLSASPNQGARRSQPEHCVQSGSARALQGAAASKPDEFCDQWHISATGLRSVTWRRR